MGSTRPEVLSRPDVLAIGQSAGKDAILKDQNRQEKMSLTVMMFGGKLRAGVVLIPPQISMDVAPPHRSPERDFSRSVGIFARFLATSFRDVRNIMFPDSTLGTLALVEGMEYLNMEY